MKNKNSIVQAAVVGLGWPGMQHLKGYTVDARTAVIAVCDLDADRGKEVAKEHNIPYVYSDHREMLENNEIDAVSVCLPNFLHAPIAIDALNAGKHVLCEKPPAKSAEEAKEMADTAEKNGKTLMYALVQRFGGSSQVLKQMVQDGELGDVYFGKAGYVRRRGIPIGKGGWFVDKDRSGGGALIDIGVHALDCVWWLMGSPKPVQVMGAAYSHFAHHVPKDVKYDVDDATFAHILFENGATVVLESTWALNLPGGNYIRIAGTKAGATLNPFTLYTEEDGKEVDKELQAPSIDSFDEEVKHFVESIVNGTDPISSGHQGVMLMQMLDGIYKSSEEGRSIKITDL
ncbi:Gfo/Idh/MocA family oxidoreductase [Candidatus Poribacteria bacterium]|nr:Gfo/Idh/MocA family oxidoreductase [Candidatus Poribacteria bacterium]